MRRNPLFVALLTALALFSGLVGAGLRAMTDQPPPINAFCVAVTQTPTGTEGLLRDARDLHYDLQPGTHQNFWSASWESRSLWCLIQKEQGAAR